MRRIKENKKGKKERQRGKIMSTESSNQAVFQNCNIKDMRNSTQCKPASSLSLFVTANEKMHASLLPLPSVGASP